MSTYTNKATENKNHTVVSEASMGQAKSEPYFQFIDNRPKTIAQKKLKAKIKDAPRTLKGSVVQATANKYSEPIQKILQKKENNTGLPVDLKSGIENLSGYSMGDVKVHYNSNKPGQLNAHAYAQGTNIHLATGQEKHLPHEAWHVVQQKQGRVKPTNHLKSELSINDDEQLEREADIMGMKAKMTGSIEGKKENKPISYLNSSFIPSVLQGIWAAGLPQSDDDMLIKLKAKYPDKSVAKWKLAQTRTNPNKTYHSLEEIAKELNWLSTEEAEALEQRTAEAERARVAEREALERVEVERRQRIETQAQERSQHLLGEARGRALAQEDAEAQPPALLEANTIIINYVWLNDDPLGNLAKFNIYSWRALGHTVNIYVTRPDGKVATATLLGIEPGDANVIDMRTQLAIDELRVDRGTEAQDSPKGMLANARQVLRGMDAATPTVKDESEKKDLIFSTVDITKSYIGATQRGIVIDLKVGPSQHIGDYAGSFNDRFISYSRGGKTGAEVENQSMGTMQVGNELRSRYAESFSRSVQANLADEKGLLTKPKDSWFNLVTSWHGRAFGNVGDERLDVATKTPTGQNLGRNQFEVSEPRETGHGPFRVFKAAAEQTNQGQALTTQDDRNRLGDEVLQHQLNNAPEIRQRFLIKARTAREDGL